MLSGKSGSQAAIGYPYQAGSPTVSYQMDCIRSAITIHNDDYGYVQQVHFSSDRNTEINRLELIESPQIDQLELVNAYGAPGCISSSHLWHGDADGGLGLDLVGNGDLSAVN